MWQSARAPHKRAVFPWRACARLPYNSPVRFLPRLACVFLLAAGPAVARDGHVAAAANMGQALRELAPAFRAQTGDRLVVSLGSSGTLYAQIRNGAPYDVFLSADAERPQRLEHEGLGVAGTRFTYAFGRLVLWAPHRARVDADTLKRGDFRHLALANPKAAPYGAAAYAVLERLGVLAALRPKLVQGEDIGQTFQFARSGAADLAFVAESQLRALGSVPGASWSPPADLYPPIAQQAILLKRSESYAPARAFLTFLKGKTAHAILARLGYGT